MQNNLYHYCAVWIDDDRQMTSGGIVRSPVAVDFDYYPEFLKLIAKRVGASEVTLTSLTYLGQEQT